MAQILLVTSGSILLCFKVSFIFYPVAAILIASRFYALALLAHEGVHLLHHRFLGTSRDPDVYIYQRCWKSKSEAIRQLLKDFLTGKMFVDFCIYFNGIPQKLTGKNPAPSDLAWFLGFWLLAIGLVAWSGQWFAFLVFWLIPILIVMPWLQTLNLYQHFEPEGPKPDHAYNAFFNSSFVNWLMFPLSSGYHEAHHRHPGVPFYNLPNAALERAESTPVQEINRKIFQ